MIDSSKLKTFSRNTIVLVAFYFISRLYVTGYWPSGCVCARPALCHWSTCSPSCCLESICHCSPFWIHTIPFHFSCTGSYSLFLCSLFLILLTKHFCFPTSLQHPPFMDACVFVLAPSHGCVCICTSTLHAFSIHSLFGPLLSWWALFWWFPRLLPCSSTVI